ncbi:hypothetical protein L6164_005777 [Bauhinia variegata]|uniref:Uncharacterized protein n=1 Tax=Bauhinia variegata TaxID=167791 RepID=A0ACB9PSA6_BAUVA|nr:hypothetical protein L6164_005777 [Bauhinia variegata]
MEITITSRETIKPISPTPEEHKIYKLSLFDELQIVTYLPTLFFYPKTDKFPEPSQISHQLKQSLSEALAIFYPVAGRRNDLTSIICNDEGSPFYEAKVNMSMAEFLKPPKLEFLNKLLPCEPNRIHKATEPLPQVLIQLNSFNCGGIAIGVCNLHTLLDGYSGCLFKATWAAICRGSRDEVSCPDLSTASSFFPPMYTSNVPDGNRASTIEKNCTTRRFLFGIEAINILRAAARDNKSVRNPSRYDALAALISKHMILARKVDSCDTMAAFHLVDMRRRIGEPFNKQTVGNLFWAAMVVYECNKVNPESDIKDFVTNAREKIGELSRELFLSVQSNPHILIKGSPTAKQPEGVDKEDLFIPFLFTSWLNVVSLNEFDFGWGKPVWAGVRGGAQETLPNIVVLMETNEGVEAWITMEEKYMGILETDLEFLRFASPNPSVSSI